MRKHYSVIFISILLATILSACGGQASDATDTPQPVAVVDPSDTPLPAATETPEPTQTLIPEPTETPVPTATEIPRFIEDDFSTHSDIWGDCLVCEWRDGEVLFGPIPAVGVGVDQLWYVICEACGEHTYYRVAADVTYLEGFGSGTFGMLAGLNSDDVLYAATVSRYQTALYESFDFHTNSWGENDPVKRSGAVRPGFGTNRIEVTIKPSSSAGHADIFVNFNGENVFVLYNRPVKPSTVGLYLGWHSIGVLYDNFEYEVLDPIE